MNPSLLRGRDVMTMPAVVFLIVYTFLLFCIPSQLIVRQIGSPGTPANLWGIAGLLWWFAATVGGLNPVKGFTPLRATLGILTSAVLISYAAGNFHGWYSPADIHQVTDELWTLVQVHSDQLSEKMISGADRGLLSFAGWSGVLLLTGEGLRSWADLERLVSWICRFGAFVASLGIVQFFTGVDIAGFFTIPGLSANSEFGAVESRSILNRISSTAVHPIEFGVVMAGVFFLALHRCLHMRTLTAWIPTVLVGVALPMAVSRSAILAALLIGGIVFAAWPSRWRLVAIVIAPFAAVGMRLVAPGLLGTIRSLFTNLGSDPSISGRTSDYSAVLAVYVDHPIFGRGLFTFIPRYYRILDNQFLGSLVELGAVGLAALLVFLGTGFVTAQLARRRLVDGRERHLALVVSACIVGLVSSFATFDVLDFPMVTGLTFLLIGMAATIWRFSQSRSQESDVQADQLAQPPVPLTAGAGA